jgi:hypothetical protein
MREVPYELRYPGLFGRLHVSVAPQRTRHEFAQPAEKVDAHTRMKPV